MKKSLLLLIPISFLMIGCTHNGTSFPVNAIPKKNTSVVEEVGKVNLNKHKSFQNDRRPNFDYDNLGYYSNQGAYVGSYDRAGYYFDDTYYPYNDRFRYEDRVGRNGAFSPNVKHFRTYRGDDDGSGHYYYVPERQYLQRRPHHPVHYEERSLGSGSYNGMRYQGRE